MARLIQNNKTTSTASAGEVVAVEWPVGGHLSAAWCARLSAALEAGAYTRSLSSST